jgi:hypothetical protein
MTERKYQIQNDKVVQGQVIGDHPLIYQHFHGTDTQSSSPSPAPPALIYNGNVMQQLKEMIPIDLLSDGNQYSAFGFLAPLDRLHRPSQVLFHPVDEITP